MPGSTTVDQHQIWAPACLIARSHLKEIEFFVSCEWRVIFTAGYSFPLSLPLSARSSAVLPKANAKCQNSTLPKLSNSPRDLAWGAIHQRGWFHGLTRRSNRLEFKKGNSGALLAMSFGIGVRIEGICETDEAKKTVRETRRGDGKHSRISCRSNRSIRLICRKWKQRSFGEKYFLIKGKSFHM